MKKSIFGKWSFVLTIISLVLGGLFLLYGLTGGENYDALNRATGYTASIIFLVAIVFSIISKVKKEAGKWKIAPLIGLGIVILAIIIMFYIFLMNDFAP